MLDNEKEGREADERAEIIIMLWYILGVSLIFHIRNEENRKEATVQPITTHLMHK